MLEKHFQKKVITRLRKLPGNPWVTKLNDLTTIGLPDVIVMVEGKGFALELKTKSKLSEIQYVTLEKMEKAGWETFVATPENFNEIFSYIEGHAAGSAARFKKPARFPHWVLPKSAKKLLIF